jgi:preprotein translocase subunit SecF
MLRKVFCVVLVGTLLHTSVFAEGAWAKTKAEKQVVFAGKVKAGLEKLGTGEDTRVQLKLRDKTKLSGYVREINTETFVVTNLKTDQSTAVAYADVAQVKGQNLTRGQKIAIGVGIAAILIIVVVVLVFSSIRANG